MRGDRILTLLIDQPWAITAGALNQILEIIQRPVADLEAVAAQLGRPLANSNSAEKRGTVSVIPVTGPIFRYSNLFTQISGATSVDGLAADFQASLDDPEVRSILMVVNSPGGAVDGINELADMIRAADSVKPVTAYVDNLAASAGYWLASAAGSIVANESAFLGSIGVVAAITDKRGAQERQGVKLYEIVSSQSPNKRVDPSTDEGRAQILEVVDAVADLFISRVASFRNVTTQDVLEKFGGGKVLPAARAIAAGMADRISPGFESLVAELNVPPNPKLAAPAVPLLASEEPMAENTTQPPADTAAHAATERQRIAAIMRLPEAEGRRTLAEHIAYERDFDVETARQLLSAAPKEAPATPPAPAHPLAAAMETVNNPKILPGQSEPNDLAAEVAAVLRHVPEHRRARQA